MKLKQSQTVHFIGIGGIGTSALAQILHRQGKTISGSDMATSEITQHLQDKGITIASQHTADNLPENCNLVIYSPAIPSDNPELQAASKKSITCLTYPQALGEFSQDYFTIAVAGTHGKSTTTAMASLIALENNLDPTVIVGTKLTELENQNYRVGEGRYLIVEACEYKQSFLSLKPDILIITNLELDHLDYFKDLEDYQNTFKELISQVKPDGKVILPQSLSHLAKESITWNQDTLKDWDLSPGVPGQFNKENALSAALAFESLGLPREQIKTAIKKFHGTWRRMERKEVPGHKAKFINDYAHHPTEVEATLTAIREDNPDKSVLCVFQPHQLKRTEYFLDQFAHSFSSANQVIITPIYQAKGRDTQTNQINAATLAERINEQSHNAQTADSLESAAQFIKDHQDFDIIITMGAGDISNIYNYL